MLGKTDDVLGIACEHNQLSLTLIKGGTVKKTVSKEIPENIVSGSNIRARNLFADFLKEMMRENQISCKNAAYALPGEAVFTRNINTPKMDPEQIRINVPYEFRDFIRGELKEYVFDYLILPEEQGTGEENAATQRLFAVAVERSYLEETAEMFLRAGLRLIKAAPTICSYEALLTLLDTEEERNKERCFLDIGRGHTGMLIYKNGHYKLMHMIDNGERRIVQAVADEMNVDMHIAITYLHSNYENCMELPSVVNVYKDFSLEVLKGINFYEVSDMTSRLADLTICGNGAQIPPLVDLLKKRIAMNVTTLEELLPEWNKGGQLNLSALSLGVALSRGFGKKTKGIKRYINFMTAEEKPSNTKYIVPAVAAGVVIVALFSKFAVYDRFERVAREEARVLRLEKEIDEGLKTISGSESLSEEYYHYTWSDMTEEEIERPGRSEVAELVSFIGQNTEGVKSYTISGQDLNVVIAAHSLESLSRLVSEVKTSPIVESATVQMAQSGPETEAAGDNVDARLIVHLHKKGGDTAAESEAQVEGGSDTESGEDEL